MVKTEEGCGVANEKRAVHDVRAVISPQRLGGSVRSSQREFGEKNQRPLRGIFGIIVQS
jgi:hypothetical protein